MSSRPKRLLLSTVALLGFILPQWLLVAEVSSTNEDTKFELYYGQGTFTKHEFQTINMNVFEMDGQKTWQVEADSAANNSEELWNFENVDGSYLVNATNKIIFSGDSGLFNPNFEKLDLKGNVRSSSTQGYNFETEALGIEKRNFENQNDVSSNEIENVFFSSKEKVHLFDDLGEFNIKAVGFEGNMQTGLVYLLSDVWSKTKDEKGAEAVIESDKAKIQSSLSTIKFYENLRVTQEKFKITGDEADFFMNDKTNEIESIRVRGNIFATDGVKTALSDKVDLKLKEDAIIFQGSPRIRVGENEMVGEEILITNNQKNVQVIRGNIKSTNNPLEDIEKELEEQ